MLVEDLYNYTLEMLCGSHKDCERIHLFQKPSKQFIIGSLADSSKDWSVGSPTGENKIQTKSALRHNSMSVMFLINKKSVDNLRITPFCSIFYKVFPTFEEQKKYMDEIKDDVDLIKDPGFKIFYKRKDCKFLTVEAELNNNEFFLDFTEFINDIIEDNETLRSNPEINKGLKSKGLKGKFDPIWIKDKATYEKVIKRIIELKPLKVFNWGAKIIIEKEPYDSNSDLIIVRLINITQKKKEETEKYELFLFNCKMQIELNSNELVSFQYKYKYEDYKYVKEGEVRTLNCQAELNKKDNIIITKPYGFFEQIKKSPRTSINEIHAKFKDLKNSLDTLDALHSELKRYYVMYIEHPIYKDNIHEFNNQFKNEVNNFYKIMERFEDGINTLKTNSNAKKAFFLMNRVFEEATKDIYDEWRVFQIIFIVMLIPEIMDTSKNREIADIIHVETGGGKSEAYFGLVLFLLFWDRLRGKYLGVSAITKFPLRMLSIQQLQRIAKIVAISELIREEEGINGEPFSIGYYVGVSEEFPRHTFEKITMIKNSKDKVPGILLNQCPKCGNPIYLGIDEDKHRIFHNCEKCNKKYFLYFTNSEIYRFIPSFIVSTVDKLASVALNRRFKNLLGGKLSFCSKGHGFVPRNDKCEVKTSIHRTCEAETAIYENKVEGPVLMIQDELHLLREGFGTINSHFESLLNTLLIKLSNKKFKYISMTATVAGAKEQIDNLYGKEHFIFPGNLPRGLEKEYDFFFEYPCDEKNNHIIQRILIGLKPNLRDNQYASLLTIYHLANFIRYVKENLDDYSKKYSISNAELEKELQKYQCILTYHGKKADVFGMNYFLHPVVTSKLMDFDIVNKPLTGDNTLDEIRDVILKIQNFPLTKENFKKLHATFATNVVSHGVDIDNWNIMIFQGMTRDTSEYIQALSRAGRRYKGIIFLWFYPNRVRDLSYYKNFNLFHDILQHRVEKTPLTRWTKLGFKQTFTSLFCAGILNYISNEIEQPIYTLDQVNTYFDSTKNRQKLIEFLKEAYYTRMNRVGSQWILDNIACETERRLNKLKEVVRTVNRHFFPNVLKECDDPYFRTQYGMRGIQDEILLKLDDSYVGLIKKYKSED